MHRTSCMNRKYIECSKNLVANPGAGKQLFCKTNAYRKRTFDEKKAELWLQNRKTTVFLDLSYSRKSNRQLWRGVQIGGTEGLIERNVLGYFFCFICNHDKFKLAQKQVFQIINGWRHSRCMSLCAMRRNQTDYLFIPALLVGTGQTILMKFHLANRQAIAWRSNHRPMFVWMKWGCLTLCHSKKEQQKAA